MTDLDQQRISEWIGDAFAILCVRVSGTSDAEVKLRLEFESILRQLGTSPLHMVADSPPPFGSNGATNSDLRLIRRALDSCLAVFDRYEGVLTTPERSVRALVRSARKFADDELRDRERRSEIAEHAAIAA